MYMWVMVILCAKTGLSFFSFLQDESDDFSNVTSEVDDIDSSERSNAVVEEIKRQAIIFQKVPLTQFQTKVNDAAFQIALSQPSLLKKGNRGKLLEKARKLVADEGYTFKKGVSRSKVYGNPPTRSKRSKLNADSRMERIKEVEEDLADIMSQMAFKDKRLGQAESIKNYKVCDKLSEELSECKARKRELERELKLLKQKDKKSKKRLQMLDGKQNVRSSTPIESTSSCSTSTFSISPPASLIYLEKNTSNSTASFEVNNELVSPEPTSDGSVFQ